MGGGVTAEAFAFSAVLLKKAGASMPKVLVVVLQSRTPANELDFGTFALEPLVIEQVEAVHSQRQG